MLWTNARGVKLGVEFSRSVRARFDPDELTQLPDTGDDSLPDWKEAVAALLEA